MPDSSGYSYSSTPISGGGSGWADAISSFLGAFTNMLGLGMSESSNRRANELNYYMHQETLKQNMDMFQQQMEFARQNWYREQQNFLKQRQWSLEDRAYENEYNSPMAQRLRYEKAGLNPALMMQGQGAASSATASQGQAPNFGSPPSAVPTSDGHPWVPFNYEGLGLSFQKALDTYMFAQRNEADIAAIRQRVDNETAETKAKILSMGKNDEQTERIVKKLDQEYAFNEDSYSEKIRNIKLGNDHLVAETAYTQAETSAVEYANSIAPEVHDMNRRVFASNIAVAQAQVAELLSRKDLNDADKELVAKKIVEQVLRNSRLPKTLHNDNAIQVATYNQIMKVGAKLVQETKNLEWEEMDLRKGYRQHTGNNRSLEDIIEVTLKRNGKGARMPSMQ